MIVCVFSDILIIMDLIVDFVVILYFSFCFVLTLVWSQFWLYSELLGNMFVYVFSYQFVGYRQNCKF